MVIIFYHFFKEFTKWTQKFALLFLKILSSNTNGDSVWAFKKEKKKKKATFVTRVFGLST